MEPLTLSLAVLALSVIACFLAGLITRNYSHVDRLWSILPPVYIIIWLPGFIHNPAFLIPAILVVAWGVRLTWNFGRRGGYTLIKGKGFTGEDYRWPILRNRIKNRFQFELFNFFFISLFQLTLIFAFTLPVYYLGKTEYTPGMIDYLLYSFHLSLLIYESVADNQQFSFYAKKNLPAFKDQPRYLLGFNTTGLWQYSRHPNYMAELGQWIVVWLYLVSAGGLVHWSGLGALTLVLLFIGSTRFTESISVEKYPRYREWQKATPAFIPFLSLPFRKNKQKKFWKDTGCCMVEAK